MMKIISAREQHLLDIVRRLDDPHRAFLLGMAEKCLSGSSGASDELKQAFHKAWRIRADDTQPVERGGLRLVVDNTPRGGK